MTGNTEQAQQQLLKQPLLFPDVCDKDGSWKISSLATWKLHISLYY